MKNGRLFVATVKLNLLKLKIELLVLIVVRHLKKWKILKYFITLIFLVLRKQTLTVLKRL
ncbi:hypothetical protein A2V49_01280 [candidate division WWE3 bacterium RBG_19FT_COMBO_34_6]|uniref:Uncharacterized protein n=1 Tax=candidate division WWE3 bacterium RBG_19FT_COMBO_34_6 TaxID=1802612 RepID=A0A1F4UJX6_UNCKA|nr:MAG: hypothetical protein A2V49_01280 [candidate division WWE3 bacterium RBG_19FT_COMBO_34_6]